MTLQVRIAAPTSGKSLPVLQELEPARPCRSEKDSLASSRRRPQLGPLIEELRAEREVIFAAGTYGSPQLLMLSGIRLAADLAALGIHVQEDLLIGERLQDHPVLNYFTDVDTLFSAGSQ
jgi:choline dehydrogenase